MSGDGGAGGGISSLVFTLAKGTAVLLGGACTISAASSYIYRQNSKFKKQKYGRPCGVCKGKGFYMCKLCKGKGKIEWSPLFDPVVINPCLCPTCHGYMVQHCLNCLGAGNVL